MGFTLDVSISAVTVFLQGLLSFFRPAYCRCFPFISAICPAEQP